MLTANRAGSSSLLCVSLLCMWSSTFTHEPVLAQNLRSDVTTVRLEQKKKKKIFSGCLTVACRNYHVPFFKEKNNFCSRISWMSFILFLTFTFTNLNWKVVMNLLVLWFLVFHLLLIGLMFVCKAQPALFCSLFNKLAWYDI